MNRLPSGFKPKFLKMSYCHPMELRLDYYPAKRKPAKVKENGASVSLLCRKTSPNRSRDEFGPRSQPESSPADGTRPTPRDPGWSNGPTEAPRQPTTRRRPQGPNATPPSQPPPPQPPHAPRHPLLYPQGSSRVLKIYLVVNSMLFPCAKIKG
ncbi:uncharacterized protein LOC133404649 [Phycodurus eques]|uniref:uncharacterized protein LOC133404649 n=1 Tax=Phycodurus eques TaxID=693459 RepID=UPI002ACEC1AE|nr:uncharacterized protein LOC133404649 [Phycodurus eques]